MWAIGTLVGLVIGFVLGWIVQDSDRHGTISYTGHDEEGNSFTAEVPMTEGERRQIAARTINRQETQTATASIDLVA